MKHTVKQLIIELRAVHDQMWDFSNAGDMAEIFVEVESYHKFIVGKDSGVEHDYSWESFNAMWRPIMAVASNLTQSQVEEFYKENNPGEHFAAYLEEVELEQYEADDYNQFGDSK